MMMPCSTNLRRSSELPMSSSSWYVNIAGFITSPFRAMAPFSLSLQGEKKKKGGGRGGKGGGQVKQKKKNVSGWKNKVKRVYV
jgi:hypothetical protein